MTAPVFLYVNTNLDDSEHDEHGAYLKAYITETQQQASSKAAKMAGANPNDDIVVFKPIEKHIAPPAKASSFTINDAMEILPK